MTDPLSTEALVEQLTAEYGLQNCHLCDVDSATWVRCGRGDCANDARLKREAAERLTALQATIAELDAKIDALMLEYCPDETTQEQRDRWAANQAAIAKGESHE
jgi:hypothetical protein